MTQTETPNTKLLVAAGRGKSLFCDHPDKFVIIGVDTPHKQGEHPLWDERCFEPLDDAMVLNIMALGVLEPVLVEPEKDTKRPVVVDGRRRVLHAREACRRLKAMGEPEIEIEAKATRWDEQTAMMVMISANEHRRADKPLHRIRKAVAMLHRGTPAAAVANSFGVSAATIALWEEVAALDQSLLQLIEQGQPVSAVLALSKKPKDEQEAIIATVVGDPEAPALEAPPEPKKAEVIVTDDGEQVVVKSRASKKRASKKKGGKKLSKKDIEGAPRGKVFFRHLLENFGNDLPPEFVLGVKAALGLVKDEELPKKAIGVYFEVQRWDSGEIDAEALSKPAATIARRFAKKAE